MKPEELQLELEGWDFEAKRAAGKGGKGGIPESMWETYSALADTDGGKIVLGVSEKPDGTLTVTGIEAIEKLESDLWNTLNNPQKVSANLLSKGDVERLSVDGTAVLVITVPRAERRLRPVYINGNLMTGTYRRNVEGDYRCKEEHVRRMVADADDRPRDSKILEHFGMEDLDPESLSAYLKVPFQLEKPDLFRRDETLVHEGLREALVNALIHADYTGTTGIRVFKKHDGFEFINPGGLRIPVDAVWQGGTSDCRNPAIQVMFQMIGAGEKAGSGFPKIKHAWEEQHWKLPNIHENIDRDETTLSLSIESLMPQDAVDYLVKHIPEFRELPERQRLILLAVYAGREVTHRDLLNFVPGHSRDLTLDLQALLRKGFLERLGSGRGCSYQLPVEAVQDTIRDDVQIIRDTTDPEAEIRQDTALSGAEASGKRRVSVGKTSGKILDACRERSTITIPELAVLIGVTERSIQRNLQKLQTEGLLRRMGGRKEGYWEVAGG